jgi:hypothetical protein
VANAAPVVDTASTTPSSPTTGQTLTAAYTAHDADGDTLTPSYQWSKNGTDISGANGSTLNLATAGNGDKGDLIRVRVTVSDGTASSAPLTAAPVTVANSGPAATVALSPANPGSNATVTATATKSDPDGDAVSLTYVWKVNGSIKRTFSSASALSDSLDLSVAGNGDPGDVVRVEVTPSDGTLGGSTAADQVTVAAAAPTVYANDLFSRSLANSWGSAGTGGAYTLQGTAADYAVTGSAGTIALAAGVTRSALLTTVSALDVDLSFRVATNKVPAGGAQYIYGVIRRVSASAEYRAKIRIANNGAVFVQASFVSANVETPIGTEVQVTGLTASPGSFIWLRAQVSGTSPTTIRIRAWADGSTEPSTWQYTATNAAAGLQIAGAVGLRAYTGSAVTNGPITLTFDDFRVTGIGGP